jgi:Flp pilus assembly pilin Flp
MTAMRRFSVRVGITTCAVRRGRTSPDDHGATSVEYALMVSLIALVLIASVIVFGQNTIQLFHVPDSAFHL